MSVNLVPQVQDFSLERNHNFDSHDRSVHGGCVQTGDHDILKFTFQTRNYGDTDLHIGDPSNRPDLFENSDAHGHQHLKNFLDYTLYDETGSEVGVGEKRSFCLMDSGRIPNQTTYGSGHYHCDNQGISAGYYDQYTAYPALPCQFLVIDGVSDGKYTLQATANVSGLFAENCSGDNTTWAGIEISGNTVTQIDPPWIPEDTISVEPDNVQAKQVSHNGRTAWKVVENGHWIMDFGGNQSAAQRAADVIKHYNLGTECFIGRPDCPDYQPVMYWLTEDGNAPVGSMQGETPTAFNPGNLKVSVIGGQYYLVDGSLKLLNFGPSRGNARAAKYFLEKYDFTEMCTVGSNDEMRYFKSDIDIPEIPVRPWEFLPPEDFEDIVTGPGSGIGI